MKRSNTLISVIVPCFNEAENIPLIILALETVLLPWDYEIIIVDDGSTDGSDNVYVQLAQSDERIKYLRFSRNFGHQAAIKAGIDHANGDAIITIDADLQQPPSLITQMIQKWKEGADIVEGVRQAQHKESWFKQKTSSLYYWLLAYLSDYQVVKGVSDFRLIDKKVAKIVKELPENHLYLRGLFSWMGFEHAYINYHLEERQNGMTRYTFGKMLGLASSGVTSMSVKPLKVALIIGVVISLCSFLYGLYALSVVLFTEAAVPGWTSTIISVLFMAGFQLIVLGVMGEYLGKLFMESKRRPVYLIKDTNDSTDFIDKSINDLNDIIKEDRRCTVT